MTSTTAITAITRRDDGPASSTNSDVLDWLTQQLNWEDDVDRLHREREIIGTPRHRGRNALLTIRRAMPRSYVR